MCPLTLRRLSALAPRLALVAVEAALLLAVLVPYVVHNGLQAGDAIGHVYETEYLRDHAWPSVGAWNPHVFLGYPVGFGYPPLSRWVVGLVALVCGVPLAFKLVTAGVVLAVPPVAWWLGRRLFPRARHGGAWGLVAVACVTALPARWLGLDVALGGTLESTIGSGMLANAMGFLALLGLLGALARHPGPAVALLVAATLLAHFVMGALAVVIVAAWGVARLLDGQRAEARDLAFQLVVGGALAGVWLVPFAAGSASVAADLEGMAWTPAFVLALGLGVAAALGPLLRGTGVARATALAFLVVLFATAAGEAVEVSTHFYRLMPALLLLAGLVVLGRLPLDRLVPAVPFLLVVAALVASRGTLLVRGNPPLAVPEGRVAPRALVLATQDHAPGELAVPVEVVRHGVADVSHGISMQSAPNAPFLYHAMSELSRAFPTWSPWLAERPGTADLARLRFVLDLFAFDTVITDARLGVFFGQPELDLAARHVVCTWPRFSPADRADTFFVDAGGRFEFRVYNLGAAPSRAVPLSAPLAAPADFEAAAQAWFVAPDATPRPCRCDPAAFPPSAPDTHVALEDDPDDPATLKIFLPVGEPTTAVVKVSYHPFWRVETPGAALAEVAPHLLLVRGQGPVVLRFDPAPWTGLGWALSGLGAAVLGLWAWRRRRALPVTDGPSQDPALYS